MHIPDSSTQFIFSWYCAQRIKCKDLNHQHFLLVKKSPWWRPQQTSLCRVVRRVLLYVNKKSDLRYLQRPIKWRQATLWETVPPTLCQPRTKRGAGRSRGKHPRLWGRKWCHWPPRISRRQFPGNLSKSRRKFNILSGIATARVGYNRFKALLKVQSRVTHEFKSMVKNAVKIQKFVLWGVSISQNNSIQSQYTTCTLATFRNLVNDINISLDSGFMYIFFYIIEVKFK